MNWYDIQNTDCISAMHKVKSDSVDLILTDPPYNLGLFMKSRETNLKQMRSNFFGSAGWDNLEFEEWIESMDDFFAEAARTVKVGGSLIMFMSLIKIETIIKLAEKHGFYYKTTGIWHKLNPMPRNMNLHESNLKTLPKIKELDAEYSKLLTEKKARYPDYRKARDEMQELLRAQKNIELFFDEEKDPKQTEHSR